MVSDSANVAWKRCRNCALHWLEGTVFFQALLQGFWRPGGDGGW